MFTNVVRLLDWPGGAIPRKRGPSADGSAHPHPLDGLVGDLAPPGRPRVEVGQHAGGETVDPDATAPPRDDDDPVDDDVPVDLLGDATLRCLIEGLLPESVGPAPRCPASVQSSRVGAWVPCASRRLMISRAPSGRLMRSILFFVALLPLAGCLGNGPDGIWMVQATPVDLSEDACTTTGTENFDHGVFPTDEATTDETWEYTETHVSADVLYFVQIETTGSGEAVLMVGADAYPGVEKDKSWVFAWESTTSDASSATHQSGYTYSESTMTTSSTTFTITPDGDVAVGNVNGSSVDSATYSETDEWNPDTTDILGGQIPADAYLVAENEGDDPPVNRSGQVDCSGTSCEITATVTCAVEQDFDATLTDYDEEDAYDYLMRAGQD